jgi:hypothetical protein
MAKRVRIPKSTATNAYDLLGDIRRIILEEPRRYDQTWWRYIEGVPNSSGKAPSDYPACGTVCCVAGWVTALTSRRRVGEDQISPRAQSTLGLSEGQALDLFSSEATCSLAIQRGIAPPPPQTPEHAQLGALHIANFMAKYKAQLKAKAL